MAVKTGNGENKMTDNQVVSTSNNNQSTDKVLAIIELLCYSQEPLRLIDIANRLHFNTSTALRFLNSLEQNVYIFKDKETLRYRMTYKICGLASQVSSSTDLIQIASQPIKELSTELRECVCLAVEENYSIIYIYVSDGPGQILRTTQRIGKKAPMHCTGVGKMILSDFSDDKIEEVIALKGLTKYTENTLCTPEALYAELRTIRQQGYAYDNQECEMGARCIAFPIRDYSGHIIASLSVTGPLGRMTDEFISVNFSKISEIVQKISYQFGFQPEIQPINS